eukprot:4181160-Prymnesium_polylepis.1
MDVATFLRLLRSVPGGLYTSYDNSQRAAIAATLERRVAVIQGPPGTGKSTVGRTLIALFQSLSSRPTGPILLLSYKNHALDDVLESCALNGIVNLEKIVRVGSRSKSEVLSKRNLSFLMRDKRALLQLDSSKEVQSCEAKVNDLVPLLTRLAKWRHDASYLTEATACTAFVCFAPIAHIQQLLQNLGRSMQAVVMELRDKITNCLSLTDEVDTDEEEGTQKACKELEPLRETLRYCMNRYRFSKGAIEEELLYCEWSEDILSLSPQEDKQVLSLSFNIFALFQKWMPKLTSVQNLQRRERPMMLVDSITAVSQAALPQSKDDDAQDAQDAKNVEARRRMAGDDTDSKEWFSHGYVEFSGGSAARLGILEQQLSAIDISLMREHADIWSGTQASEDRALLLHTYMQERVAALDCEWIELSSRYEKACKDLAEMKEKRKADILKGADLIGMTSTGAALNLQALAALRPTIVIAEEAGELLESQMLAVLLNSVQHLVMIGDHKQLRPGVENYELVKHKSFDISLFERLANNGLLSGTLDTQSRMRPEFVPLLQNVYPNLKSHPRVGNNQVPSCLQHSMFFWSHAFPEQSERSCKNKGEADMIGKLTAWLISENVRAEKVTILASYSAQVKLLRDQLAGTKSSAVHICTIDEFQGDENDVIIVSLVRSTREVHDNRPGSIGYLNVQNRFVVAASRARCAMILVGNAEHLRTCIERQAKSRNAISALARWDQLLHHMKSLGLVGPDLPLCCPRHREAPPILMCSGEKPPVASQHSAAYELQEIRTDRIRLCKSPCIAMMSCGQHTCKIGWCHPDQEEEHRAERCTEVVPFVHVTCGHEARRECREPEEEQKCCVLVKFNLKCGHSGRSKCHIPKEMFVCEEIVPFRSNVCGHNGVRKCCEKEETLKCMKPCARELACGHPCPLKCFEDCAKAVCGACAEKERIEKEERQKQIEATIKAAREKAKLEAKLHRQKGSEFLREQLHHNNAAFHECQRIVHLNQQSDHKNPIMVVAVEKVYNAKLETQFLECKQDMLDPTCEPMYKFHGTSTEGVDGICKEGFRQPDSAKPNMDKKSGGTKLPMYGHGIYLASDSTKSAQKEYTQGSNMLLVCKTLLGRCLTKNEPDNHLDRKKLRKQGFDSVFAPAGSAVRFDEYIVYDKRQTVVSFV